MLVLVSSAPVQGPVPVERQILSFDICGGLRPDITFWLDIDPAAGRARAAKAGELDRLELEKLDFHYRVYEGYKKIAEAEPDRVKRINAADTVENICSNIYACLEELCAEKGI